MAGQFQHGFAVVLLARLQKHKACGNGCRQPQPQIEPGGHVNFEDIGFAVLAVAGAGQPVAAAGGDAPLAFQAL